jgi:hypothetical protein
VSAYEGIEIGKLPIREIDWSKRGEYIRTRSARKGVDEFDVEPAWATEAATEPRRVLGPDRSSISGRTLRAVGWSDSAGRLLVVIILPRDDDPRTGRWWGVNAWSANSRDIREYWDR